MSWGLRGRGSAWDAGRGRAREPVEELARRELDECVDRLPVAHTRCRRQTAAPEQGGQVAHKLRGLPAPHVAQVEEREEACAVGSADVSLGAALGGAMISAMYWAMSTGWRKNIRTTASR